MTIAWTVAAISAVIAPFCVGITDQQCISWTREAAQAYGLDPDQLVRQFAWESDNWQMCHVNSALCYGVGLNARFHDPRQFAHPHDNIYQGARVMRENLDYFNGDYTKALAAYNCGKSRVDQEVTRYGSAWRIGIPAETQLYLNILIGKEITMDFPRPHDGNLRGIHWSASTNHGTALANWQYWRDELEAMHIRWVKLLDDSRGSSARMCERLLEASIIPIVRLYRSRPNPGRLSADDLATVRTLVAIGVRYFEVNNEPNIPEEWQGAQVGPASSVVQTWVDDAEAVLSLGGLPAFPALAQTTHGDYSSVKWYQNAFAALNQKGIHNRAENVFRSGAWLAVHAAVLNHCYQDSIGVWHFEYPYDPISDHPGITIMQDDNSLIGYRVPVQILRDTFGLQVPVISTEGGVFLPPDNSSSQPDSRYPAYDAQGHAAMTVAMFEWLERNAASQVFAMCPWLIANERMGHKDQSWTNDAWYQEGWTAPVVAALKASKPAQQPVDIVQLLPRIREAAWNALNIPHNAAAAFPTFARQHNLGVPVTAEIDLDGVRLQGYANGIVYCPIGVWDKTEYMPW